ncbi:MAG TPA: YkvA family protein [Candidatus Eisenbacteria bacterium]|nr:YkvA family protein [Candidatus Eisenbacteria bacterium]
MRREPKPLSRLKTTARRLKGELAALYLAYRDPRVPWYTKFIIVCVVGYALSPIDLIPDPIPVLGYIDDLILLPLGIYLAIRMIPEEILTQCREKAAAARLELPQNRWAGALILMIWIVAVIWIGFYLSRFVL